MAWERQRQDTRAFVCGQVTMCAEAFLLCPMPRGKIQVLRPVEIGDVVFAGADMVTDEITHGLVDRRLFIYDDALFAEEGINRAGEFAGDGDSDRPR